MKLLIGSMIFLLSAQAVANGWINDTKIVDVRWYGDFGYITTESVSDPDSCGANANASRYFTSQTVGYQEFMSMSLAAMVAGNTVNVLVDGCYGDHNQLKGLVIKR